MGDGTAPADRSVVRAAVDELGRRLDAVDEDTRRRIPERSVVLHVTDLEVTFRTRLAEGRFTDVHEYPVGDEPPADARMTMTSHRLLELVDGELGFAAAWATGKIRVSARLSVLLELRRFL